MGAEEAEEVGVEHLLRFVYFYFFDLSISKSDKNTISVPSGM